MDGIFETITTNGERWIINFKYVVYIKETIVGKLHGGPYKPAESSIIEIGFIQGGYIYVSCDEDDNEICHDLIRAYKDWGRHGHASY